MQAKIFLVALVAFLVENNFSKNVKFSLSQKFYVYSACPYNSNV